MTWPRSFALLSHAFRNFGYVYFLYRLITAYGVNEIAVNVPVRHEIKFCSAMYREQFHFLFMPRNFTRHGVAETSHDWLGFQQATVYFNTEQSKVLSRKRMLVRWRPKWFRGVNQALNARTMHKLQSYLSSQLVLRETSHFLYSTEWPKWLMNWFW